MLVSLSIDKVCPRGVLDQVVATRGETARNVRVVESSVPSNNTIAHLHAITALICGSRRYTPSLMRHIAIDGAEGNSNLTSATEDTTPIISSLIVGDSTVSEREPASLKDASATDTSRAATRNTIVRDDSVSEGEFPCIENATSTD